MELFTAIDHLKQHNLRIGLVNNLLAVVNDNPKGCNRYTGPRCSAPSKETDDKSKYVGAVVGLTEIQHSAVMESKIAKVIDGKVLGDRKPKDVVTKDGKHSLEVKTLMKGEKQSISVHPDSLVRKIDDAAATGTKYHTVVIDDRKTYGNGNFSDNYSGNRVYYKRGCGRYSLSTMHPCKNMDEVKQLINTPDSKLPDKAKGSLPDDTPELRAKASKASDARKAKDADRKERLKAEGKSAYERQTI